MERMAGTLTLRQAATLYNIPPATLSSWVNAGIVRRLESGTRGQRSLLVEGDVAAAAKHYVPGAGRNRRRDIANAVAWDARTDKVS